MKYLTSFKCFFSPCVCVCVQNISKTHGESFTKLYCTSTVVHPVQNEHWNNKWSWSSLFTWPVSSDGLGRGANNAKVMGSIPILANCLYQMQMCNHLQKLLWITKHVRKIAPWNILLHLSVFFHHVYVCVYKISQKRMVSHLPNYTALPLLFTLCKMKTGTINGVDPQYLHGRLAQMVYSVVLITPRSWVQSPYWPIVCIRCKCAIIYKNFSESQNMSERLLHEISYFI